MKRYLSIIAVLALILGATSASAFTITPINVRPQPVGVSAEQTLQSMLDLIYGPGVVSATTDQSTAGIWELAGASTAITGPVLAFESAGFAPENIFGIWSFDGTNITTVPIFNGSADGGVTIAQLAWAGGAPDTVHISDTSIVPVAGAVNVGAFTGISRYYFGFYLEGPGTTAGYLGKFWSVDSLNPGGSAQMYAYLGTGGRWTFAFEDTLGGDGDHNDLVVTSESLTQVPEPGSMLLLGTGLFGLAAFVRRRK